MASNQIKTQMKRTHIEVWQSKVLDWFSTRKENNSLRSNEQLYLWGPSCTGKTSFIIHLLGKFIWNFLYLLKMISNKFSFFNIEEFNEHFFSSTSFNCRELNKCMDEYSIALIDEFSGKLKELAQIQKQLQVPMIVISNIEPSAEELQKLNSNKYLNLCVIQVDVRSNT